MAHRQIYAMQFNGILNTLKYQLHILTLCMNIITIVKKLSYESDWGLLCVEKKTRVSIKNDMNESQTLATMKWKLRKNNVNMNILLYYYIAIFSFFYVIASCLYYYYYFCCCYFFVGAVTAMNYKRRTE